MTVNVENNGQYRKRILFSLVILFSIPYFIYIFYCNPLIFPTGESEWPKREVII